MQIHTSKDSPVIEYIGDHRPLRLIDICLTRSINYIKLSKTDIHEQIARSERPSISTFKIYPYPVSDGICEWRTMFVLICTSWSSGLFILAGHLLTLVLLLFNPKLRVVSLEVCLFVCLLDDANQNLMANLTQLRI